MTLFSVFKARAVARDAKKLYQALMQAARAPEFYQRGLATDNYDGRTEMLALHLAIANRVLVGHGEHGQKLAQAVYDEMVNDFDRALREEGLGDTGIKIRIKPLAKMALTRLREYDEALASDNLETLISKRFSLTQPQIGDLAIYITDLETNLDNLALGELARGQIGAPKLRSKKQDTAKA